MHIFGPKFGTLRGVHFLGTTWGFVQCKIALGGSLSDGCGSYLGSAHLNGFRCFLVHSSHARGRPSYGAQTVGVIASSSATAMRNVCTARTDACAAAVVVRRMADKHRSAPPPMNPFQLKKTPGSYFQSFVGDFRGKICILSESQAQRAQFISEQT